MHKVILLAIAAAGLIALSVPEALAQGSKGVRSGKWVLGPPGCVRVWMVRSRQTRYAGAPRCRRIPV